MANSVIITGRLAKDVVLRTTSTGKSVGSLVVAVDDGYGANKKAYFFNVIVWGKAAEACAQYVHKGSKVLVNGRLTSRSYDSDEGKRYVTEIVADAYDGIEFLESRRPEQDPPGTVGMRWTYGQEAFGLGGDRA